MCLDFLLQNVRNEEGMIAGGWLVNAKYVHGRANAKAYVAQCGKETFWGFMSGPAVGYVQATFKGVGTGILDFENCYSHGKTKVYLNGMEEGSADSFQSKVIGFSYKSGDILKITEEQTAIFKINSLRLIGCK